MVQASLRCQYRQSLNNGIHRLTLQDASTEAVDDALMILSQVLDEHPVDEPLLLLIDARAGVPPLNYFFAQLRKVYGAREALPPIRAAYLYANSILLSVLQSFFNALGINASRRFMKNGTEIEAQNWLLSDSSGE